jgi:hypothetical protein
MLRRQKGKFCVITILSNGNEATQLIRVFIFSNANPHEFAMGAKNYIFRFLNSKKKEPEKFIGARFSAG